MGERKTRKENEALERAVVQSQRDWWEKDDDWMNGRRMDVRTDRVRKLL
jgi:hypothetical protein